MQSDKREPEKKCGSSKWPNSAEGREKPKLVSCSGRLKEEQRLQEEQPEDGDVHELPSLCSLILQRYEGETREGHFNGEGMAWFEGGHMYKGTFSKGLMDGCGVFTWADGLKYEGEFVCNIPMGQGTYTWLDGSSYTGQVYNGVRHGSGTYKCAKNGMSYTGQWVQSKRHGKGTVYYNQDKTSWYKGDWVKNNRDGWGVRRYPSGNMYSGEWKNNLRHGEGTMKWLKLHQQYDGMWQNGVQHGRGTHSWMLKRANGSHYSQNNQYEGDFVQGQRHGHGTFYYAGGAIYEGEWRSNKKHGKGKFTFEDGRVFEGDFMDDQIMMHGLNGSKAPTPPLGKTEETILHLPDMTLNIECLLEKIPEGKRDAERKQVEFVVLRREKELRSIYSFYSSLGRSSHNILPLSRLQFWRLLKDCNVHHHSITLTQVDHLIREDARTAELHSPFTPMFLRRLLSCLVVVAYYIYHKDMVSQNNLLAACFSKLLTDNILPNAKNVKGFLFRLPGCAVVAASYFKKCWEVYQAYCKVYAAPRDDQTMTCRHLLWMYKDLCLLDSNLTPGRLMQIITAESRDPSNLSSCLDLEITFLEFFEVLLGSAEVKCRQVSVEAKRDLPEIKTGKSNDAAAEVVVSQQDNVKTEVTEEPQSAEHTEEHRREGNNVKTKRMEAKDREVELWNQMIHQFFNHFLFPAFEHNQIVSRNMKEEKHHQEAQRQQSQVETA